jgi:hypothetical protein
MLNNLPDDFSVDGLIGERRERAFLVFFRHPTLGLATIRRKVEWLHNRHAAASSTPGSSLFGMKGSYLALMLLPMFLLREASKLEKAAEPTHRDGLRGFNEGLMRLRSESALVSQFHLEFLAALEQLFFSLDKVIADVIHDGCAVMRPIFRLDAGVALLGIDVWLESASGIGTVYVPLLMNPCSIQPLVHWYGVFQKPVDSLLFLRS